MGEPDKGQRSKAPKIDPSELPQQAAPWHAHPVYYVPCTDWHSTKGKAAHLSGAPTAKQEQQRIRGCGVTDW